MTKTERKIDSIMRMFGAIIGAAMMTAGTAIFSIALLVPGYGLIALIGLLAVILGSIALWAEARA